MKTNKPIPPMPNEVRFKEGDKVLNKMNKKIAVFEGYSGPIDAYVRYIGDAFCTLVSKFDLTSA